MNIAKSAVLLAALLTTGSIFAQESTEYGRHVRVPGEATVAETAQLPDLMTNVALLHEAKEINKNLERILLAIQKNNELMSHNTTFQG